MSWILQLKHFVTILLTFFLVFSQLKLWQKIDLHVPYLHCCELCRTCLLSVFQSIVSVISSSAALFGSSIYCWELQPREAFNHLMFYVVSFAFNVDLYSFSLCLCLPSVC
ncbi:hypothetical protein S83_010254 [Arachis hypogaea]